MKRTFETITNVATLIACVVIVAFLVQGRVGRAERSGDRPPTLTRGERIHAPKGVAFQNAQHTLLMAVRKDCHYCEESVPFYRRLVDRLKTQAKGVVQVAVVTTDDALTTAAYLRERQVTVDQVVSLLPSEMRSLKVSGTPTLILIDQIGLVKDVWIGKLTESQEAEVATTLGFANYWITKEGVE